MSVGAAAPSPCLPLEKSANFVLKFRLIAETSNRRNVHPVSVTFRLFVYSATCRNDGKAFRRQNVSAAKRFGGKTFRRQNVSAAKRFGGKTFRRQRFSAFRLHVVIGSGKLFGATRDSADRRQRFSAFRLHVTIGSGKLCGATRDSAARRPTIAAEPPKKRENRRKSPKRR